MSNYILIRHKVRDFAAWKRVYDLHRTVRDEAGLKERKLFRRIEGSNEVIILFETKDLKRAHDFMESADLAERMKEAGVVEKPDVFLLDDVSRVSGITGESEIEELKRIEEVYTDPVDKKVDIEFVYQAANAKEVFLTGSFNNWDTQSLPLKRNRRGQWKATVRLAPGRYEYEYFVDGVWAKDIKCTEAIGNGVSKTCVIDVAPKMAA
jgi:hypothetical protein